MAEGRFRICVIKSGLSKNNTFYPGSVLQKAVSLFEGARVFAKSDAEHLAGAGKDARNIIGGLSRPEYVPGDAPGSGEITAELRLIDPDNGIGRNLVRAFERGMQDLYGFSIAVEGTASAGSRGERKADTFTKVHSVDLIVEPGAGGRFINFIEAAAAPTPQGTAMNRDEILALIKAARPDALEGKDTAAMSESELKDLLKSLIPAASAPAAMTEAVNAAVRLRERIAILPYPEAVKAKLRREVEAGAIFNEAALTSRIHEEQAYLSAVLPGGHVVGLGIEVGDGPREKGADMLDAFFDPAHKRHRDVRSFRECYVTLTGDTKLTGRPPANARFSEALNSTSFSAALGNAISRRVIADYNVVDHYDVWRDMVRIVPVQDFRTQERVRWGGYGALPAVAENAPYQPLTSPTDEMASYSVTKRGGTETVTLEMITNDDVGAIQSIPQRLMTAAKRTLSRFVLSIPRDNAAIYDGKALFHADHGNLSTGALSAASVAAARLAIRNQKEKDSLEKLALVGRYLWVPDELEQTAYDLFIRNTNNDPTYVQSLAWKVRPVWCWTDPNDWCVSVDPVEAAPIELGFLKGEEDPEIFVQDDPKAGSFFTNDVITYKVRHVYGAAVTDFRPIHKSVVA